MDLVKITTTIGLLKLKLHLNLSEGLAPDCLCNTLIIFNHLTRSDEKKHNEREYLKHVQEPLPLHNQFTFATHNSQLKITTLK